MRQLTSLLLGFGLTTGLLPRPVPFALAAPQDAPDPPLVACASESALMLNIDHLKGICVGQMGEQVSKVDDHLPGSCRTDGCARAVYRVHTGCSAFVHSSDFYKMFAQRLDSLKSRCDVDQAVAPIPTTPTFAVINGTKTAHNIIGCGGTLIDRAAAGNGPNGVNWQQDITITAGVGLRVELAFQLLWLPTGTTIYVFDGDSKDSPSLGTVSDSCLGTPPTQKYTSSARSLTLRFITEPASNGQLMAFSATIGCVCTVGQAGCGTQGAGTCEATQPGQADGHCVCSDGWLSADCSDGSCRGMDCGAGHCTPVCKGASCQPAQCQCPEGFTGEKCALKSSECNEPEIKDNTIVLDSGQVRWSGCLAVLRPLHLFPPFYSPDWLQEWRTERRAGNACDAPNPGYGSGPYTPLTVPGGHAKWYRFKGGAGIGLPTAPFPGDHFQGPYCNTGAGGWLSGYPTTIFGSPAKNYNQSGTYPTVSDGKKLVRILWIVRLVYLMVACGYQD
jgi:hypothetical protein